MGPGVMVKILGTPIWQISEARIHRSGEVQTPQKAIKWIQEIMDGHDIGKVRIEAKTRDIIPVYIYTDGIRTNGHGWSTTGKTSHGYVEECRRGRTKQMKTKRDRSG